MSFNTLSEISRALVGLICTTPDPGPLGFIVVVTSTSPLYLGDGEARKQSRPDRGRDGER